MLVGTPENMSPERLRGDAEPAGAARRRPVRAYYQTPLRGRAAFGLEFVDVPPAMTEAITHHAERMQREG
jgi:hypothetical protein